MPAYIVKPTPDEDFYVVWSDVVDNVTFAGTRAEVLTHRRATGEYIQPDRIERADANGTSALWPEDAATGADYYLGWNDEELLVQNDELEEFPGWFMIKRSDLRQYVEHGAAGIWIPCEEDGDDDVR